MNEKYPSRNYVIRALSAEEIPSLAGMMRDLAEHHNKVSVSFSGAYPVIPIDEQLKHAVKEVEKNTALVEAVFYKGGMMGFGKASYDGDYGEIDFLYLAKELRGRGIGELLLNQLIDYLKEKAVKHIDLKVILGNPAKRFYKRNGFVVRSEIMSLRL